MSNGPKTRNEGVDWLKLLPFVRVFQEPTFSAGHWTTNEGSMPFFSYSQEAARFVGDVHVRAHLEAVQRFEQKAQRGEHEQGPPAESQMAASVVDLEG